MAAPAVDSQCQPWILSASLEFALLRDFDREVSFITLRGNHTWGDTAEVVCGKGAKVIDFFFELKVPVVKKKIVYRLYNN